MSFEQFGSVHIFRPSLDVEHAIRQKAKAHLLSRFSHGEYKGAASANQVIQHQFHIYEKLLHPLIPQLASSDAVEFLLYQYDQAWQLLHGRGLLDLQQRETWAWIEPRFKRAIKFLVELICIESAEGKKILPRGDPEMLMSVAIACAENMVALGQESDRVHSIFPKDCVTRVFDSGVYDYEIVVEGKHANHDGIFSERVIRDREARNRFVDFPQFDNHTATHQNYLDSAFKGSFQMSYGEFIYVIKSIIVGAQPSLHPKSFPTLFVHRGKVIDELQKNGFQRAPVERAIDGFSITAENLIQEKRVVWNSKQENRAYRRGFFVFPHETGPHLAFSREMAQESLIQLVNWISYQHLPKEWISPITLKALSNLSQAAGKWFEGIVSKNLHNLGFVGKRFHRAIASKSICIEIPPFVGELDFLGYNAKEKIIILAEAKMVMTGLEPRFWRDDLHQFVNSSNAYAKQFRKKIDWIKNNLKEVSQAIDAPSARGFGFVMLTLYPCVARMFIDDFPCVSITEFMLDYEQKSGWPYSLFDISSP